MAQNKRGHFFTGALFGIGLGLLLAPKEGSETREELKKSLQNLKDTIKNVDIDETKEMITKKIADIKKEATNIDLSEAKKIIIEKKEIITNECDNFVKDIKKEQAPKIVAKVNKIKENTNNIADNVIEKINDEAKKNNKKKNKKNKNRRLSKSN